MARRYCLLPVPDTQKTSHSEPIDERDNHRAHRIGEHFKNSVCTVCENRRPEFALKKDFTYAELDAAIEGFSPKNFLSEGGFGFVYRGTLHGHKIAVKQHKCASLQGEKEFNSEVNALGKARHENVVMLLGSCSEGNNRLLAYEYVCNGALDEHLSQHSWKLLSWPDRIKVAIGAAKGLLYLHENNIIHRDMRPSNILVTHDYEAMLGDFGLARTEQIGSIQSTNVVGTLGHMAPEYTESGKVSNKTNMYSFGVVLFQLITRMRTTNKRLKEKSSVGWVLSALSHIEEGRTCSIVLMHCSPSRSNSSYEFSDSPKSDHSMEPKSEGGSRYSGYTPINLRQPPSLPIACSTSSCSSSMCLGQGESPSDDDGLTNNEIEDGEISNDQSGLS